MKAVRETYDSLLQSSTHVMNQLKEELQKVRSQFEKERGDREELEKELTDLRQNSVTASELLEPADLLNQLKARRKKSRAESADIDVILGLLNQAGSSS